MIDRKIYCVWVGENTAMNENRINGLESIRKNSGVEVVLVNNDNLNSFVKEGHPIHEGFKYLSDVHKSDYLRCYLMHHYGGGYSDIKPCSWKRVMITELVHQKMRVL
jgi:mannosyltransferase OCH1-like enzyme